MSRFVTAGALALAIGMLASATASAQSSTSSNAADSQAVVQNLVPAVKNLANTVAGGLGDSAPLSSDDLGATTGGSNLSIYGAVTDQTLQATTTDNTISTAGGAITNGPVTVQPNAFSGFSGIGNFVMNTGNQNNVQGSLNVTIVMAPAAP